MSAVLLPTQYEFYIIGIARHKTIRLGVNTPISTYLRGNGTVDQPSRVGWLGADAGGNGGVAAVRGHEIAGVDASHLLLLGRILLGEQAPTETQRLKRGALAFVYGFQKM